MLDCVESVEKDCQAAPAHGRMREAHQHWHEAAQWYGEPTRFIEHAVTTVRALRGAIVALQHQSRAQQTFDRWHADWQALIRSQEVLRWLVQPRSQQLSGADLEPASSAEVSLLANARGTVLATLGIPPLAELTDIPRHLASSGFGQLVGSAGLLLLQRRWAALNLPDWELLEALGQAYGLLADPLAELHHDLRPAPLNPKRQLLGIPARQPECMFLTARARTSIFHLRQGKLVHHEQVAGDDVSGERPEANAATEAAGGGEDDRPDPLRRAAWHFEDARRRLVADGAYVQRVSLWLPDGAWVDAEVGDTEAQDRYGLWSRIAAEVVRTGAEAVMTSFVEPARRGSGGQRLVLAGETAGRQHRTYSVTFERRGGSFHFGRARVDDDGRRWYFLDPVREAWSRQA